MSLVRFEDIELNIIENVKHEFLLTTKEVALGYGCKQDVIRQSKYAHSDEFVEDKHFLVARNNKNQKVIHWTKKGIVRLGFFIKSKQAKEFRDWAEDYIINKPNDYQIKRENIELKRTLKRLLVNSDELDKLKEQNLRHFEENDEMKRKLQKIKNIL